MEACRQFLINFLIPTLIIIQNVKTASPDLNNSTLQLVHIVSRNCKFKSVLLASNNLVIVNLSIVSYFDTATEPLIYVRSIPKIHTEMRPIILTDTENSQM
jgi:hypothetical protein